MIDLSLLNRILQNIYYNYKYIITIRIAKVIKANDGSLNAKKYQFSIFKI